MCQSGDGSERRTESKDALIGHIGRTADHVSCVALGHLVIADVAPVHPSLSELLEHGRDLLRARGRLQLEREEDLGAIW